MELLIVDDEYYSVEWIRNTLMSSSIPLTLYCAYSMEEAQEIFLSHPVKLCSLILKCPVARA